MKTIRLSLWLILAWLGLVVVARAQTNAPVSLAPLVSYVLQNGAPSTAESYITQPLHLGSADVTVTQKGWKTRGDGMNHLVAVSQSNHGDVLILLFNHNITGVCWLTSPTGELRATVKFDRATHTASVVPNDKVIKAFEVEKTYLLRRAAAK